MAGFSKLVDMERDDDEKLDAMMPEWHGAPDYPPGLSITLTDPELEKLDLDGEDCEVGDLLDLRAFARVTSVSHAEGQPRRIEMQIVMLAVEDEDEEEPGE